tara:strand:+ start:3534 stop:4040 length:507 start_codon:yes stop_codon:yes gene_type:complete
MKHKYHKWNRVKEYLFNNPSNTKTVRQISKNTNTPVTTTQRYLKVLKENNIIDKENNLKNTPYTKFLKTMFIIDKIHTSGLLDYLTEKLTPDTIILFGSIRKGEYTKESDLDMFIQTSTKKKLSLSKFENTLNHKIDLFIESNISNLPKQLQNNIINGIKLQGYLKIK